MALRIFDHLFVNHGWRVPNGVQTPEVRVSTQQENTAVEILGAEREEIERRSMIARLSARENACGRETTFRSRRRMVRFAPAWSSDE